MQSVGCFENCALMRLVDAELCQNVKALLDAVWECPEAERQAFLREAMVQDPIVAQEVNSLLANEDYAGNFIEKPIIDASDLGDLYEAQVAQHRMSDGMVGQTISHYRIVKRLGVGGMGVVYEAEDLNLGRPVALKFLWNIDEKAADGFRWEAHVASALDHPNICTVYEIGWHDGAPFLAMQFLAGETLTQEIAGRPLRNERILDLGVQIADALDAAHAAGIIHRDIKSGNVVVDQRGHAKILDFGLAMFLAGEHRQPFLPVNFSVAPDSRCLRAAGTLACMAPEQLQGGELDARTDLFSFGIVLYEMATGRLPFEGTSAAAVIEAIRNHDPFPAEQRNPELLPAIGRIIGKALEKNPDHRYRTAAEVRDELKLLKQASDASFLVEKPTTIRRWLAVIGCGVLAICLAAYVRLHTRQPAGLGGQDTILLADFANQTGEPIFDETLKRALRIQLEESPFLNVLPDQKVNEELRLMQRPPDVPVRGEVARELCLRARSTAVVAGSISKLGSQYVVDLEATNCQSGDSLGGQLAQADNKERVIRALSEASTKLRVKLGESPASNRKFQVPVEEATTRSLAALQAYSLALKARFSDGEAAAIPLLVRATELDPNFAMAYASLGTTYSNLGRPALGATLLSKAFSLRGGVSTLEKFHIDSLYYDLVTGDAPRAIEVYLLWRQTYPRQATPYINLGVIYEIFGQQEKSIEEERKALSFDFEIGAVYANLATSYVRLNQLDKAGQIIAEAKARGVQDTWFLEPQYMMAFLRADKTEMERTVAAAEHLPVFEGVSRSLQANTEGFLGHRKEAERLSRLAVQSALRDDDRESAASYLLNGALQAAEFGDRRRARNLVEQALTYDTGKDTRTLAALVLARIGQRRRALEFANRLERQFRANTLLQSYWLPTVRAAAALESGRPKQALEFLQITSSYDLASPEPPGEAYLYPVLLRGLAYLQLKQSDQAEIQFRKILDHPGIALNLPVSVKARLGLAQSCALKANTAVVTVREHENSERSGSHDQPSHQADLLKARDAYQQFFALWADDGIPVVREARIEYRHLH
jgi:serine/threonine protein kinase/Tfp pilus assembly protein PilF